jgi:hypothetical protein
MVDHRRQRLPNAITAAVIVNAVRVGDVDLNRDIRLVNHRARLVGWLCRDAVATHTDFPQKQLSDHAARARRGLRW